MTDDSMIFFPDEPDADPIDQVLYKLRRAYSYTTLAGVRIDIPENFKTDLLSAPRSTWTILGLPPDGLYRCAAVVHDWLYENQGDLGKGVEFTRKQCDDILLEIMTRVKISWFQRQATYAAVRLFGGTHWHKMQ